MKVFHGIIEIAGQMGILCGALKKKGHIAVGYNTFQSYLGYKDHLINTDMFDLQDMFKHMLNFYDIFHYHYGTTMWSQFNDLELIKKKGKKMIMHHWGNDVRFHDLARINNSYVYTGDSPSNKDIHQKLSVISKYISEAIVQDYEVLPYVSKYYKKVHVLPLAIDLRKFKPFYPEIGKKRPLILHAPTNPDFKGTSYIETAINKLKSTHQFDYKRIEKMNHTQVVELYKEADIIVDQVCCGSHGLLSVESMALGKPVIAFIRPDLIDRFPGDLPIVNGNPDNVEEKIKMLLDNPMCRKNLGLKGRKYVEKHHSRDVVVERLLAIYSRLT
ncbi:glycosyltransferase family 4 protein [Alkaliphilus peptidifermentans]|uniref:Glycosyltransferase involved in cell wall bisynthesis n=1 Tax=Alkaliphilus peptidifermentans DSM 18978 TaxID=1120976 RepID=A0A1G5H1A0_9FIRM|nr:glycosyltransferase family 4 protein [Alkaliphilus peptidifermentans]SCY57642.1 Glycosyltransferase involved in cell wall bisynthesis [Alkaliphilus peptidifermentans DSM 18978]